MFIVIIHAAFLYEGDRDEPVVATMMPWLSVPGMVQDPARACSHVVDEYLQPMVACHVLHERYR
jgi:hypothetical protein